MIDLPRSGTFFSCSTSQTLASLVFRLSCWVLQTRSVGTAAVVSLRCAAGWRRGDSGYSDIQSREMEDVHRKLHAGPDWKYHLWCEWVSEWYNTNRGCVNRELPLDKIVTKSFINSHLSQLSTMPAGSRKTHTHTRVHDGPELKSAGSSLIMGLTTAKPDPAHSRNYFLKLRQKGEEDTRKGLIAHSACSRHSKPLYRELWIHNYI